MMLGYLLQPFGMINYWPFIKLLERLNRKLLEICHAGSDVPIPLIDDEDLEF
jgi:hypothetical protein